MRALIKDNNVYGVAEEDFTVHPDYVWVECDNTVEIGDSYINDVFTKPIPIVLTREESIHSELPQSNEQIDALWDLAVNGSRRLLDDVEARRQAVFDRFPAP